MTVVTVAAFLISSRACFFPRSLPSSYLAVHEVPEVTSARVLDEGASTVLLSTEDIVVGSILALVLAAFVSFLNAQSNNSDVVLPDVMKKVEKEEGTATNSTVADKSLPLYDWNEIKRPKDYILYTTSFRQREQQKSQEVIDGKEEQKWVVWALLMFFVPIFTFELFLTTSRQIVCGPMFLDGFAVARFLCSPYDGHI